MAREPEKPVGDRGDADGAEQTSGIAFWAHVGGFVAGLPLVLLLRQSTRAPTHALR